MAAKKKPNFRRQDSHKKIRLAPNWRKPTGADSKMRVGLKGYPTLVKVGYGAAAAIRGLNRDKLREVVISNVSELVALDPKKECVLIGSAVGLKKKLTIAEEAQKLKLTVSHVKDVSKFIEDCKNKKKSDTESKSEIKKKRDSKREADKKAAEKKKKEKDKKDAETEAKNNSLEKAADAANAATESKKKLDKTLITKT